LVTTGRTVRTTRNTVAGRRVRAASTQAGPDAFKALGSYFKKMTDANRALSATPVTKAPKFLAGTTGKKSMVLWQKIYRKGGDAALLKAETEFDVFVWSVRDHKLWKFLIQTPDAFISRERKVKVVQEHLAGLGCSGLFIEQMTRLFFSDEIKSLEQIRTDFLLINREHRREVDVEFVSPAALDADTVAYYKASIALNYLKEGDNMIFNYTVDPTINKGYRILVKGELHDFTHDAPKNSYFTTLQPPADQVDPGIGAYLKSLVTFADIPTDLLKQVQATRAAFAATHTAE